MTEPQFIITTNTAVELQAEREELERQMAKLREQHQLVLRKIEAVPLFLSSVGSSNGAGANGAITGVTIKMLRVEEAPAASPVQSPAPPEIQAEESLPTAVKQSLQRHGRMTSLEIRNALLRSGIPRERFGTTFSYLYTVLARLVANGQIQRRQGKYHLPPGVTIPEETKADGVKP